MKQSVKAITDILTACGCRPATATNTDGNTVIKVNAPTIPQYETVTTLFDSELEEYEHTRRKEG